MYDLIIEDEQINDFERVTPIRIYRSQTDGLSPVLLFFHGGGFVCGNLDTLEGYCREIASFTKYTVISVDYPLAPEHPFPTPPEAMYAAINWIYKHLTKWQGDPKNFFVSGSSSGATLSAVVSIMARDRNGPEIRGQILLCPMTDKGMIHGFPTLPLELPEKKRSTEQD